MRIPLLLCFTVAAFSCVKAQNRILQVNIAPPVVKEYADGKEIRYADSASLAATLLKIQNALWSEGYITYTHSLKDSAGRKFLSINPGKSWKHLRIEKILPDSLAVSGMEDDLSLLGSKPLHPSRLMHVLNKWITHFENNGYPFVQLSMEGSRFRGDTLFTSLRIERNDKITLDSIRLAGNCKISEKFIRRYLGFELPELYDESKVRSVDKKLGELSFLQLQKPTTVVFSPGSCKMFLYADNKKNSSFDGIVGFRQNEKDKLELTGEIRLELENSLFRHGEQISFNWRKFQSLSQDLKSSFVFPYLFNLPFGLDAGIHLLRQDTTYLSVSRNAGIRYIFKGQNYVKGFIRFRNSDLINTKGLELLTVLPPYADIQNTGYGLEGKVESLDYRWNPSRGYSVKATGIAGSRTIRKNPALNPVAYDSISLNESQYTLSGQAAFFVPLTKSLVIMNGWKYGKIIGRNLFSNEMERIGGLQTLRGFDEESLFCSQFLIGTLELRYIVEKNSHLFVFYDQAYYENFSASLSDHDTPLGLGAGIRFQTKAGIFTLGYAVGKQYSNPIQFSTSKVHFGISSYF